MDDGGWSDGDVRFMREALDLASAQVGRTGDNPAVGCVLVRGGVCLGRGVTGDGGRPHGEENALAAAKAAGHELQGATAYVTLEPCNGRSGHGGFGGGKGCSQLLVEAGVARVVFACADPHRLAAGGGIVRMREAAIEVSSGLFSEEALAMNQAFFRRISKVEK